MHNSEFPPLSAEKLAAISNPERNAPTVVSMARELIELRRDRACMEWFIGFVGEDFRRFRDAIEVTMEATQ